MSIDEPLVNILARRFALCLQNNIHGVDSIAAREMVRHILRETKLLDELHMKRVLVPLSTAENLLEEK